eukprot:CAMPEP_0170309224 /NCGR_PEP_ID=MMETSP0116_2-20130129/55068_1 /TAXON_ID=400756 /ORGANISM="Durinskia baltica, Strain CSIRO CS-38" /LENGTH=124 /DNA_ID=CAMNT_0010561439 /DNA_START=118 /DNA_END=492 /DNA_ORIENTATION=+
MACDDLPPSSSGGEGLNAASAVAVKTKSLIFELKAMTHARRSGRISNADEAAGLRAPAVAARFVRRLMVRGLLARLLAARAVLADEAAVAVALDHDVRVLAARGALAAAAATAAAHHAAGIRGP